MWENLWIGRLRSNGINIYQTIFSLLFKFCALQSSLANQCRAAATSGGENTATGTDSNTRSCRPFDLHGPELATITSDIPACQILCVTTSIVLLFYCIELFDFETVPSDAYNNEQGDACTLVIMTHNIAKTSSVMKQISIIGNGKMTWYSFIQRKIRSPCTETEKEKMRRMDNVQLVDRCTIVFDKRSIQFNWKLAWYYSIS